MSKFMMGILKDLLTTNLATQLSSLTMKEKLREIKHRFDASEHGGAPILGISKPVIKAHGSSDANAIKNAVSSGEISEERINDAVKRILKVKKERKLFESLEKTLDEKISNALETVGCEEHKKAERELAAKSITVLENKSGNLFKGLSEGKSIVFFVPSESIKANVEFALDRLISEKSIDITYKIKEYGLFSSIGIDKFDAVVILTDTSASWDVKSPLNIYNKSIENNIPTAVISCRLPYDTALQYHLL